MTYSTGSSSKDIAALMSAFFLISCQLTLLYLTVSADEAPETAHYEFSSNQPHKESGYMNLKIFPLEHRR